MISLKKCYLDPLVITGYFTILACATLQSGDSSPVFRRQQTLSCYSTSNGSQDSLTCSPLSSPGKSFSTNPLVYSAGKSYQDITDLLHAEKEVTPRNDYSYTSVPKSSPSFWYQISISKILLRYCCCYTTTESPDTDYTLQHSHHKN